MGNFKVGDRVRVKRFSKLLGTGTVIKIMPEEFGDEFRNRIKFDNIIMSTACYGNDELELIKDVDKNQFLLETHSNINYQLDKRVLELSKEGLKKYYNVDKIILIK